MGWGDAKTGLEILGAFGLWLLVAFPWSWLFALPRRAEEEALKRKKDGVGLI